MVDIQNPGLDGQSVVCPGDGVLACDLAGGAALLDTESGTYYALNDVGAAIWALIAQSATISSLEKYITDTFDVTEATAHRDLDGLIGSLAEHGLVRIERH